MGCELERQTDSGKGYDLTSGLPDIQTALLMNRLATARLMNKLTEQQIGWRVAQADRCKEDG